MAGSSGFPLTIGQRMYQALLCDPKVPLVVVTGPAGSGKTMLATKVGSLHTTTGRYKNFVVTRPVQGSPYGYLPGTLDAKMKPWIRHIHEYTQKKMDVIPLEYMRGLTFDDAFIIADEMQNSTQEQMRMLLTRVGKNSKIVVTGDVTQKDGTNFEGLDDLIQKIEKSPDEMWKRVLLTDDDVQRSELVKRVLRLYQA